MLRLQGGRCGRSAPARVIARAQRQFFLEEGPALAFEALLADLLELTQSEYGFIGEVVSTPAGLPFLRTYAITDIAWNEATRRMVGQAGAAGLEFHNLETLFGAVIRSGEPVIANDPASDARSGGLPAGHPPLRAFLGVPFQVGNKPVGMAGVANRPGGYDGALLTSLEPFLVTLGSLIAARRAMTDSAAAEARLRSRQSLDALIARIARSFVEVSTEGTDAAVEEALRQVMTQLGAQQISFARSEEGGSSVRITHAVGSEAAAILERRFELAAHPFLRRRVREEGFLFVRNIAALPKRAHAQPLVWEAGASAFLRGSPGADSDGCAIYWREPAPAVHESDLRTLCVFPQLIKTVLARRDALRALQKSEEQFRTLADLLPQAVLVLDERRQPMFANRAAAVFSAGDVAKAGVGGMVVHPEDLERVSRSGAEASRLGRPLSVEVRLRVGKDRYRPFLVDYIPDQSGSPGAGLWTAFDISELRELEQRVRESDKLEAVGRLAGGIAHDFNNMLTAILGHAELAREGRGGQDEDLFAIEQTAIRAAELVRQLLAFARRRAIQPRIVDLNQLVSSSEKLLRRLIGEHITLSLGDFDEPLYVNVDPGQLEQVIVNLALNARDAMPHGGSLDIVTERLAPGSPAELRVSDTGTGMDASTRIHAFEPFFTTKGVGHGTGLGLATCYGIVRQAGGEILLESEPQKGTTVRMRLPFSPGPAEGTRP